MRHSLSRKEMAVVGSRIWQNECNGRVDQLLYWKEGEQWPSIGIGHFIWPPKSYQGPFKEGEFHRLLAFLKTKGVSVPRWAGKHAPWETERAFMRDVKRRQELQRLAEETIPLQAEFMVKKLSETLPNLVKRASKRERPLLTRKINKLLKSGRGTFALIDYLNFKGSGTRAQEQYRGHRWGLLQVLLEMEPNGEPVAAFVSSAKRVLQKRVALSDPARNEQRWIPGWFARLDGYRRS